MRNSHKFLLVCCLALFGTVLYAQDTLQWQNYRDLLLQNNPMARNAILQRDFAAAELRGARGGFDPKLYADHLHKTFKGSEYFRYSEAGVKVPTWLGLELKGSYQLASGAFINPEATLPELGQAQFGLSWTLGQGLFIDPRRAALKQARIGLDIGDATADALINDLLFEASLVYWDWVLFRNQLRVYQSALDQARIRFEGIVESYRQGDLPAIDTLEAAIQMQNRLLDLQLAQLNIQKTEVALCNFLWQNEESPFQPNQLGRAPLLSGQFAFALDIDNMDDPAGTAILASHPEIRQYNGKLRTLEVDRQLRLEQRKPELNLNYAILGSGWSLFPSDGTNGTDVLVNDIKWGLNFAYPIPNRKARASYQKSILKITQTKQELQQKQQGLLVKIRQYQTELNQLTEQIALANSITFNYRRLLDGEMEKFRFGESSLFLINSREQKWLEAQIKLLELQGKYRKAEAAMLWAQGVLAQQ